jgi:hypothetical protein
VALDRTGSGLQGGSGAERPRRQVRPLKLTEWKIGAIKLAVILEKRGYLLRTDFKHLSVDHRRWLTTGWLINEAGKGWVATKDMPDFKKQHPRNYVEIAAKFDTWKPPAVPELFGGKL